MEGEQLPKATMNNFVRQLTNLHYSPDFIIKLLGLSKGTIRPILEYVARLSDKANNICEQANKKTISAEHLEAALIVSVPKRRILDCINIRPS